MTNEETGSIQKASTTILEDLLTADDCDVDLQNKQGDTPLHIAVRQKWQDEPNLRFHLGDSLLLLTVKS